MDNRSGFCEITEWFDVYSLDTYLEPQPRISGDSSAATWVYTYIFTRKCKLKTMKKKEVEREEKKLAKG